MVEESKLGGSWYQISRYGVHNDFLEAGSLNKWILSYKSDGFFSLGILINNVLYNGHITIEGSSLKPVITINGVVYALGSYFVIYFDSSNYMYLGNDNDLFILSKRPNIDEKEKEVIMALAERNGYEPQKLVVNYSYASKLVVRSSMIAPTGSTINQSRPEPKTNASLISAEDALREEKIQSSLKTPPMRIKKK